MLSAAVLAPESVEAAWGSVRAVVVSAPQALTGDLPEITLGRSGTAADLDTCDGTFTQMLEYSNPQAPPVWAAHNNCGGDVVLPWTEGQQFRIGDTVYEVLEVRRLPKFTSTARDLTGLGGELALQTCLYGEHTMAFLGASPVTT
ncbi:hypothetical protein [Microbacterium sp. NPDC055665]